MFDNMFTNEDLKEIEQRGSSPHTILEQLKKFENGFPSPDVVAAATPSKGIRILSREEQSGFAAKYMAYNGTICKFVPASGAATRMFKELFEALSSIEAGEGDALLEDFFDNLGKYPFYPELKASLDGVLTEQKGSINKKCILEHLLTNKGLGYGSLPKGLVKFHRYGNYSRTAMEEHMCEAAGYAMDQHGTARLVFTVSPEHLKLFRELTEKVKGVFEKRYRYNLEVSFTLQKPSTDTIAVNMVNQPFRSKAGKLLFRPGGHGALIENLNDIDADIVIIKNIDNITREELTTDTIWWKKVLGGVLLDVQEQLFAYLKLLDGERKEGLTTEIRNFVCRVFCMELPKVHDSIEREFLKNILNRPLRVCGMVKNQGEPGGGPFLVRDADGSVSLQILEGAQLDLSNPKVASKVSEATHFNPVDLVCSLKDYKGNRFDLLKYVDPETGFISYKSAEGVPIKALELPGLWNGAMSRWNTIFVEVPVSTFSPVKTVFDLLRPEHLGVTGTV